MKNLVTIPIVNGTATAVFPEKCVYCGIPQEMTVPITTSRSTGTQYNRVTLALIFAITVGSFGVRRIWGALNEVVHDLPGSWADGGLGVQMMMGTDEVGLSFTRDEFAQ